MSMAWHGRARRTTGLLAAALLLALVLWWTLFSQFRWTAPAPRIPDYQQVLEGVAPPGRLLLSDYETLLQKPLFEEGRTPPVPKPVAEPAAPPPVEAPPPPDTLGRVQILGVYGNAQGGVVIVRANGKSQRVRVGDELEGWVLRRIDGRAIHFSREGAEERVLELKRAESARAAPAAPASARPPAGRGAQERAAR